MKFYFGKGSESGKYHLRRLVQAEGEGGGQGNEGEVPEWAKDLPDDVKTWDEVKNSDTREKFFDQMKNMRSFLGQSIRVPGEDAGAEAWKEFNDKLQKKVPTLMNRPDKDDEASMNAAYAAMGMPAKADEYTYTKDEGMDPAMAEQFKLIAHKQGLSKKQYTNLIKSMGAANISRHTSSVEANKTAHTELATKWGADYNRRMSLATTIAKLTDAPPEFYDLFKSGNASPAAYEWMYGISQKFKGEGTNLLDDVNEGKVKTTPDEAASQIAEIRGNKEHPYWIKADPGHKAAIAKMGELYKLKNAG